MTLQKAANVLPIKTRNHRQDPTPGENWVTMSNALTRAAHGLNLSEKRLVALAMSRKDSAKAPARVPPGQGFGLLPTTTMVTAADYAAIFDVDLNTAYDQLQAAASSMMKRTITFHTDSIDKRGNRIRVSMNWVQTAQYSPGNGAIAIDFNERLLPHLTELRNNFTTYQLKQAAALRSIYSWRLLEQLSRFESTGQYAVSVADFCDLMEAAPSQRKTFGELRRKVIGPALRELRDKDDWLIELKEIKTGRRVDRLVFTFEKNPQQSLL